MTTAKPAHKASEPIVVTLPQPLKVETPALPNPLPIEAAKPIAVTIQQVPEQHESHAADWNVAAATWVLAAATIVLAIYTYKLFKEASESSKASAQSAKDSLAVSQQAAVAAQTSADAALTALTNLERPWLFIEGTHVRRREFGVMAQLIPNNYFISFVCKNVGRAPAIILDFRVWLVDSKTLPDEPAYAENGPQLQCPSFATPSGTKDDTFETTAFGPTPQEGVDPNEAIIYAAYGYVTYQELNGKQHKTRFGVEVSPMMAASSRMKQDSYQGFD